MTGVRGAAALRERGVPSDREATARTFFLPSVHNVVDLDLDLDLDAAAAESKVVTWATVWMLPDD
ncbi:MAG: hypothetical protein M3N46_07980 [Actinomycetota bacterium]|nr:hypothetical protein [Actinomycetota bacterium]